MVNKSWLSQNCLVNMLFHCYLKYLMWFDRGKKKNKKQEIRRP